MARKRYSDEDILKLLREIEVHLASGSNVAAACRTAGINHATHYNCRKKFGGMGRSQLSELKTLAKENGVRDASNPSSDRRNRHFGQPAGDAEDVATYLIWAAALTEVCSIKTVGEIGAPIFVIHTYYADATVEFSSQFGVRVEEAAEAETIDAAARAEAEILVRDANHDVWPTACDHSLNALVAASRGDFTMLDGLVEPP